MKIKLKLTSHSSNKGPLVRVEYNFETLVDGRLEGEATINYETEMAGALTITHYGKEQSDTIVEGGEIVSDKAVEIVSLHLDDFEVPLPYLYEQKYYTDWPGVDPVITGTLYLGYNGTWMIGIPDNSQKFYYHTLWAGERKLNREEQQTNIDPDGNIVETFTRFGQVTEVDDNNIPSIDELYKLICQSE